MIHGAYTRNLEDPEPAPFRVYLINLDMPSASAGYGIGDYLEAAQLDAMDKARQRDSGAFLSDDGLEVRICDNPSCFRFGAEVTPVMCAGCVDRLP
jgi:hypothetical protein